MKSFLLKVCPSQLTELEKDQKIVDLKLKVSNVNSDHTVFPFHVELSHSLDKFLIISPILTLFLKCNSDN